ncbi:MAG: ABC transporter permease [Rhizomicrobium sp.]
MTHSDHREQFEDVVVSPGGVGELGEAPEELRDVPRHDTAGTDRSALGERTRWFLSRYALVLVWIMMAGVFYTLRPDTFGRIAAFQSIFGSQSILVFLGVAALVTLSVGEFDLSIASIAGLSATTVPVLVSGHHWNVAWACALALVMCLACGAVNAFFVVKIGVASMVVTLGTGTFLVGIAEWISASSQVAINDPPFAKISLYPVLDLPVSFYYGVALVLMLAYVRSWTPLGRHMLFVGANREVARLAGVRVNRVRAGSYLVASVVAGFGGIMLVSSTGGFDASGSADYLLPALAAVFLGTAVVQPGQFNPIGMLIGIYFLETGIFGLELLGYNGWVQDVFYGAGLVIAVAIATIVRIRASRA